MNDKRHKTHRALYIYDLLVKDHPVNKKELSFDSGVSEKSIQRDIDEIRAYLGDQNVYDSIAVNYDKREGVYKLTHKSEDWFSKEEALALAKILLESRAFSQCETKLLLNKLTHQVADHEKKLIKELLSNELFYFEGLNHKQAILDLLWQLSEYILKNELIQIKYTRQDHRPVTRDIQPLAIVFSEFYFYLIAFFNEEKQEVPIVFRLDRIQELKSLNQKFVRPYSDRFHEGEFKKRIQFMYTGKLMKIRFKFWGDSLEAVLDRLPTAKVVGQVDNIPIVETEMYGSGVKKWFLSQAEKLEVLEPLELRNDMIDTLKKMNNIYNA